MADSPVKRPPLLGAIVPRFTLRGRNSPFSDVGDAIAAERRRAVGAQGATPSRNAPLRLAPDRLETHLQRIRAARHPAIPHSSPIETQLPLLTLPRRGQWWRSRR